MKRSFFPCDKVERVEKAKHLTLSQDKRDISSTMSQNHALFDFSQDEILLRYRRKPLPSLESAVIT
ncbi:hypothetical protein Scep_027312 [Stephania cephalantha]|uniref:Uncharacterized protein n=1 Tax=Stephania cephalantha TaxID=152367 RepID=A0AAP0HMF9_9MAGN